MDLGQRLTKGVAEKMENNSYFDNFARNYRAIHTKNVKGISGVDSSYFGRHKVELIKKDLGRVKRDYKKSGFLIWDAVVV